MEEKKMAKEEKKKERTKENNEKEANSSRKEGEKRGIFWSRTEEWASETQKEKPTSMFGLV